MAPSLFTLPILVILIFLNSGLLYLCLFVKDGKKFCRTIPFFICGLFTIIIQLLLELNNDPVNAIILSKIQYIGFWSYFVTAPLLVSALTNEELKPYVISFFIILMILSWFFTSFTDLIIISKPRLYSNMYFADFGRLFPLAGVLLFIISIFYYYRLINYISSLKNPELRIIMPTGLGICILLGFFDFAGKLKGTPLLPWLKDSFSVGMLSSSLSFGLFILFSYSQVVIEYKRALNELENLLQKHSQTFNQFVQLIAKTIDAKDKYTAGHSIRVVQYAVQIARALNLDERQIKILHQASLLHDIGKIGIPDGILNKKTPLTDKERAYIYRHPILGKEILSQMSDLHEILDIIYFHHERFDGNGYPDGLKKDEIPLLARILAVADAYDAMLSERPYRRAKTKLEAIKELLNGRGKQFDPVIVEKFVDLLCQDNNSSINDISN